MNKANVILILGKNYKSTFNRYTFPLLGRPVSQYVFLAALNTPEVYNIFLSSDSKGLLDLAHNEDRINIITRIVPGLSLSEELKVSIEKIQNVLGYLPSNIGVLFANSPCISSDLLFNGFSFMEENEEYDSVVTAMKRGEFNPSRVFGLNPKGNITKTFEFENSKEETYFLDHRLMILRTANILNSKYESNFIENLLGEKTYPIIQDAGIWDIDYPWQIPQIESWLLQNGYSDFKTPYDRISREKKEIAIKKEIGTDQQKTFKVLITTVPFGELDQNPLIELNNQNNIEYVINPINRKLKEHELAEMIGEFDALIAGTEPITRYVLENATNLKLISRVGIGLDNVDLLFAKENGIIVSYTPDAPAPAVAELTIGHILNSLRGISFSDQNLRSGIWYRTQGQRIAGCIIGIIGVGRIGTRVLKHLQGFSPSKILVNDLNRNDELYKSFNATYTTKEEIYKNADVITLHVPLTSKTRNLITLKELKLMKSSAMLINTSRGGIINEDDLYIALNQEMIKSAAIDVFVNEPYNGKLVELPNCYFTCHMGSMTTDCRSRMEIEATLEVIRYLNKKPLQNIVPQEEYDNQLNM